MQLKDIQFGHSYFHRKHGECAIVGGHPHDGAALIVAYHDQEEDEEFFVLAMPEHLLHHLPDVPVFRTQPNCNESHAEVILDLVEVARKAFDLADGTEETDAVDGRRVFKVDADHFEALCDALTVLDLLPEPGEWVVGTGPAKAGAALKHLTDPFIAGLGRHVPTTAKEIV